MCHTTHLYENIPIGGEVLFGDANQHARPNDTRKAGVWRTADMASELKPHACAIEVPRRGCGRATLAAHEAEERLSDFKGCGE